ncbi:MAG: hypothetical protein COS99_06525 [Candidatus Omnitrophica bacterium CG07_land_8_20_14_0_80_42_15]|uniref:Uncharacterized protein n=1 Tax=Candidatus Aquitaenariimonas noxiae TaxID=1974741 RepID=A0A2J0KS88_9BACT|nr:MAG: hypothetical protein COS99_06525 [Candidatus Omnitrophica bacterium CG07_land_8_20_14_0_80_42_15]
MDEVKKEEKAAEVKPDTEAPKEQAAGEKQADKSPVAEKKPEEKKVPEKARPTNCAKCNKTIKDRWWYYRHGKYYCSKNCWQAEKAKSAPKPEEKKEQQDAGKA